MPILFPFCCTLFFSFACASYYIDILLCIKYLTNLGVRYDLSRGEVVSHVQRITYSSSISWSDRALMRHSSFLSDPLPRVNRERGCSMVTNAMIQVLSTNSARSSVADTEESNQKHVKGLMSSVTQCATNVFCFSGKNLKPIGLFFSLELALEFMCHTWTVFLTVSASFQYFFGRHSTALKKKRKPKF